jgi:hypothetical protein
MLRAGVLGSMIAGEPSSLRRKPYNCRQSWVVSGSLDRLDHAASLGGPPVMLLKYGLDQEIKLVD